MNVKIDNIWCVDSLLKTEAGGHFSKDREECGEDEEKDGRRRGNCAAGGDCPRYSQCDCLRYHEQEACSRNEEELRVSAVCRGAFFFTSCPILGFLPFGPFSDSSLFSLGV